MLYELLTDDSLLQALEVPADPTHPECELHYKLVGEEKFWHDFYYQKYRMRVELARRMLGIQPQNSS